MGIRSGAYVWGQEGREKGAEGNDLDPAVKIR